MQPDKMKLLILLLFLALNFRVSLCNFIWPMPRRMQLQEFYLSVNPTNFMITPRTTNDCYLIKEAIGRYRRRMFAEDCSLLDPDWHSVKPLKSNRVNFERDSRYLNELHQLEIVIKEPCEEYPYLHMDESYRISITKEGRAKISSKQVWGALRGLETFSQLMEHVGLRQFRVPVGAIQDYPRFPHRGIMHDTSRHFLPLRVLFQTIDAMEMNKLNVFHWHIVDDQAFPFVSKPFPELHRKGAFRPETHIYHPEDVQAVIEYARKRGIRVIVEFDTPGHTLSWGKGRPDLLTTCYEKGKPAGWYGPFNPTMESTWTFLETFFADIAARFPDAYLHLGGDEVGNYCWKSNPQTAAFMRRHGINPNTYKLEEFYMLRLFDVVSNLNKSYIVWQDVLDNDVKVRPDTVVHVWKGQQNEQWKEMMQRVTQKGHDAILSSCWYLDQIQYGNDWTLKYHCDPQNFPGTEEQKKRVLGGEACIWGEFQDGTNVISTLWPRASVVAERLWSSADVTNIKAAEPRFENQHCRMQQLGIRAQPNVGIGWCQCDHALY